MNISKIFFTVLALVVLYIIIELLVFWYRTEHRATLPTIDQSDKTIGSGPILKFIAVGDSVTVGAGASDLEHTYAYKVALELSKTNTVQYRNIAIIGDKTQDVIDKQLQNIITYKPDVVVISMGGNDDTHFVSSNKVLNNFKFVINELEQKTTAKIYLSTIPNFYTGSLLPWFYIELMEARSAKLIPKLFQLEDARTKIVNIHDYGIYAHPKNKGYSAPDNFHPNNIGYENWSNAFIEKINRTK